MKCGIFVLSMLLARCIFASLLVLEVKSRPVHADQQESRITPKGSDTTKAPQSSAAQEVAAGEVAELWRNQLEPEILSLDQITKDNFKKLQVVWTWKSPDHELLKTLPQNSEAPLHANGMKATPLVVNGVMYLSTGLDEIAAIDPVSGATKWVFNPRYIRTALQQNGAGWQSRGLAYWTDGNQDERLLMGTLDGFLMPSMPEPAGPVMTFGENGKVDLTTSIRGATRHTLHQANGEQHYISVDSPPVIVRNTVVVGSSMSDQTPVKEWPPGDVQAFDVRTGKLKWVFHVIPSGWRVWR